MGMSVDAESDVLRKELLRTQWVDLRGSVEMLKELVGAGCKIS